MTDEHHYGVRGGQGRDAEELVSTWELLAALFGALVSFIILVWIVVAIVKAWM